jgi:TolB-like protein/tetratricopeptide (TPR) repeat protein
MPIQATLSSRTIAGAQGRRLESWKEIATYLGRDVTTVRRWERREGLPVHRILHRALGSVYAYTAELDAWRDKRGCAKTSDAPDAHSVSEVVRPGARGRRVASLAVLVLTLAVGLVWIVHERTIAPATAAGGIRSLAVLPLENFSGNPAQDYLSDGMTEALIARLSTIHGLRVISRTSAMQFKGTRKSVPAIRKELSVDAVIEGSVLRVGDQIRVSVRLIRADTDEHLWSATYDRELQDVLALQSDVTQGIARNIEVAVNGEQRRSSDAPRTVAPEVYEAYLKGVHFLNKQNPDGTRTAIGYFQGAVEKDHTFAPAYSALAACYVSLSVMSEIPSQEAYARGKEAAQKAVALDDNLDQAHSALAWIAMMDWDWTKAETEYRRAIQIDPNSANAHTGLFFLLLILGRSEESAQEERAAEVLDPLSLHTLATAIYSSYYRRQYDEGIGKARSAIELYPQVPAFHVLLSNFYAAQGQDKPSAEEILLAEETGGASPERLTALRAALDAVGPMGLRRKRIELNEKLAGKQSINAYDIAIDYVAVGDGDRAMGWLEKALRARDSKVHLIAVEPVFDSLRSDPRFVSLLRQMGLQRTSSFAT